MPIVSKTILKSYFNDGDLPIESNYIDLIDSLSSFRIINVMDFGAIGGIGDIDDSDAIQSALDYVSDWGSGKNVYILVYFPAGKYKVTRSLDITNRNYFGIVGDGWGISVINSYASDRPVLDLLGARFFDIRNLTIHGDNVLSPSVAMFFGRTVSSPNCGNCFITDVALDGTFTKAGFYNLSAEVISITGLRSGPISTITPHIYWAGISNSLNVVSDYDTVSYTYTGATVVKINDWWLNGTVGTNIIRLGDKCHNHKIRDVYCNSYGGTGYQLLLENEGGSGSQGIEIYNLFGEGSYAGGIKMVNYVLSLFHFSGLTLKGFNGIGTCTLNYGKIELAGGLDGATQAINAYLRHVEVKRWYNFSSDGLTITSAEGCTIDKYATTSPVTITSNLGGNIIRVMDQSPHTTSFDGAIEVGGSGPIRNIFYATAILDFGSIAPGSEQSLYIACPGMTYDCVAFASPRAGALEVGLIIKQVSAGTGNVMITIRNETAGTINPASRTWYIGGFRGPT